MSVLPWSLTLPVPRVHRSVLYPLSRGKWLSPRGAIVAARGPAFRDLAGRKGRKEGRKNAARFVLYAAIEEFLNDIDAPES